MSVQQLPGVGGGETVEFDRVHDGVPAVLEPSARRRLAGGEHDDGRVGQLRDHGVAQMAVERADHFVRVEQHHCRPRLRHGLQGRFDLGREGRQVAPVEPHRVVAACVSSTVDTVGRP